MDLAIGAKQVFVMMDLMTKTGTSKLVEHCGYPLTGLACVSRVYTDVAVFAVGPAGAQVIEMADGLTVEFSQSLQFEGLDLALPAFYVGNGRARQFKDCRGLFLT